MTVRDRTRLTDLVAHKNRTAQNQELSCFFYFKVYRLRLNHLRIWSPNPAPVGASFAFGSVGFSKTFIDSGAGVVHRTGGPRKAKLFGERRSCGVHVAINTLIAVNRANDDEFESPMQIPSPNKKDTFTVSYDPTSKN